MRPAFVYLCLKIWAHCLKKRAVNFDGKSVTIIIVNCMHCARTESFTSVATETKGGRLSKRSIPPHTCRLILPSLQNVHIFIVLYSNRLGEYILHYALYSLLYTVCQSCSSNSLFCQSKERDWGENHHAKGHKLYAEKTVKTLIRKQKRTTVALLPDRLLVVSTGGQLPHTWGYTHRD